MECKENYQVNINLNQVEFDQLAIMLLSEKELNRSAFIRRLIRQEWARRHPEAMRIIRGGETCTR